MAQRNALASFVGLILGLSLVPDAPMALRDLALSLVAADASRRPALVVMAIALLVAAHAVPVVRLGLGGWLRSLPLSDRDHRRALAIGLLVPLLPLAVAEGVAVLVTPVWLDRSLSLPALVGLPLGLGAASAAAVPVGRSVLARPLALAALALATGGTWSSAGGCALLLVAWDRIAGPVVLGPRPSERRHLRDRWLGPVLAWRALGWLVLAPSLVAAPLLAAAALFRRNNGLTVGEAGFGTRLALLAALGYGVAIVADALAARRRPWPWARSLPWSSSRRVLEDAVALIALGLPAVLMVNLLDWRAALVGLAALPLLVLLALAAMPGAGSRLLGVSGVLSWRGGLIVVVLVLWPWLALAAVGAAPVAFRLAVRATRRAVVTGWQPLHHGAGGDSLVGSAR